MDTNVILGSYLSRAPQSVNRRVFRLWRDQRKLQLIVSEMVVVEYLEVLARLGVAEQNIHRFAVRLQRRETVTYVNLGARFIVSRDPDDALMLATASAGRAKFLVTNDRDLLDLPLVQKRKLQFEIVKPQELLMRLDE